MIGLGGIVIVTHAAGELQGGGPVDDRGKVSQRQQVFMNMTGMSDDLGLNLIDE